MWSLNPRRFGLRLRSCGSAPSDSPGASRPPDWIDSFTRPLDDRLKRRSHLYLFVKNRLGLIRIRLGLIDGWFPDVHLGETAESPRWEWTIDLLEALANEAETRAYWNGKPGPSESISMRFPWISPTRPWPEGWRREG